MGRGAIAGLDDPQSLNLYAYALNNPVTRVDFDGHFNGPGNDPTPKCPEGGNCDPDPVAPPIQETAPALPAPSVGLKKTGNPPPNAPTGKLKQMLGCTQQCSGAPIIVTSTNEHYKWHPPSSPHGKGLAADVRVSRADAGTVLQCAAACGFKFGLNEFAHPSIHSNAGHLHLQMTPGRLGGRGDLPRDPVAPYILGLGGILIR